MNMYIRMYIYTYICIHSHIPTYMHTYILTYIHTCTHTQVETLTALKDAGKGMVPSFNHAVGDPVPDGVEVKESHQIVLVCNPLKKKTIHIDIRGQHQMMLKSRSHKKKLCSCVTTTRESWTGLEIASNCLRVQQRTKWIHSKCSREQNGCIHLGRMHIYQIPLEKDLKSHPIVLVCNKEQKKYICKMQYMYIQISNIVRAHLDLDIQQILSIYVCAYIAKIFIRCI